MLTMPIFPTMTPTAIRGALRAKTEIALLDVRQESHFAQGHPLFAASFPLGHLEAQAAERLPRRTVPVVVYGDGDGNSRGKSNGKGKGRYRGLSAAPCEEPHGFGRDDELGWGNGVRGCGGCGSRGLLRRGRGVGRLPLDSWPACRRR